MTLVLNRRSFICMFQEEVTGLETLNIGQNAVGDEFVLRIAEPLISNKNLLRLGLQSTSLTNEAAFILADILKTNNSIQVKYKIGNSYF